jgi:hypothetical protein
MTETRHQLHRADKKPLAKRGRPHMTTGDASIAMLKSF